MTLLALLRHGETDWSGSGRIQGRTDTSLNARGRAALAAVALPSAYAAMRVASSPLQRCLQTAEALGLASVAVEPRLAEMDWGAWEGQSLQDLRARLGAAMAQNEARGFDFRPEGGESPRDVLQRVSPWLAEVASAGRPTLAVSHRGVIRVVLARALGWDMCGKPPARLRWDALHLFRLDAAGVPRVEALNVPLPARGAKEGE